MAEIKSHGILSCASNRYHNLCSIQIPRRKKTKMQTSNKLIRGPKSFVLPRRLGSPSKLTYDTSATSDESLHPPKPTEVKVSKESMRASDQTVVSIFRARSAGSLFDHDTTDTSDDEDDLLALRMANPICDSSDDDSEAPVYQPPTPKYEQQTLIWVSDRLKEDDITGFSLGGLILI